MGGRGAISPSKVLKKEHTKLTSKINKNYFNDSREFKNKDAFVKFVKDQLKIDVPNDKNDSFNGKTKVLYTKLEGDSKAQIERMLNQYSIGEPYT